MIGKRGGGPVSGVESYDSRVHESKPCEALEAEKGTKATSSILKRKTNLGRERSLLLV